jgi:multidrug efflux pump
MVSLSTLVKVKEVGGPIAITRYNLSVSAAVTGNFKKGASTGDGIASIDYLANKNLPLSMKTEWTELMYMQQRAGNTALYVFGLAVMCVFLALSALYESWTLPLAVILVVPLCLLCSVAGVLFTGRDVNIFVQIGLVVLVGLACKNAILVVEYARQLHEEGLSRFDATLRAARLRLRPILMTSLAFILGVLPLVVASGAGAEMRRSLGTAVFSGMLGVTAFGIFLTPVFFYILQGLDEGPLLSGLVIRVTVFCVFGALLGLVSGYLLAQLKAVSLFWGLAVGPPVGVLLVLIVIGCHRVLRLKFGGAGQGPSQVGADGPGGES